MSRTADTADVVIVGGGAAGLAAAVFCARSVPGRRIVCVDGARRVGAKILVSGGTRCNVTNREVTAGDFCGGDARAIGHVLRAFPSSRAMDFFESAGVALVEEADGKVFPESNRARTVLDALVRELRHAGAELYTSTRITTVRRADQTFHVQTDTGREYMTPVVVLATGGRSLPKTGSDGAGYEIARRLGHGYVATTPALVPLVLDGLHHERLQGVAHAAAVTVRTGTASTRLEGALLWTHFGASGPVILDASRHWLRAHLNGEEVEVGLNVTPEERFESLERWFLDHQRDRPRVSTRTALAGRLPSAVADVWLDAAGLDKGTTMAHLARDERRRLIHALMSTPLSVRDSRGYNYAEVTAGGIPLSEVESASMESRLCPGLFLIGEMLDVDGRLGGFNFQWGWSSAWVAADGIARRLAGA